MANRKANHGHWHKQLQIASVIALAVASGRVGATDWRMVIASKDVVVMVDAETVHFDGRLLAFRSTAYPPTPDPDGTIGSQGDITFDCKGRLMKTERMVDIRSDGGAKPNDSEKSGFVAITKGTVAELFLDRMCDIKPSPNKIDGVFVTVTPPVAAKAVFGLLKIGLDSKQASELASQKYWDENSLVVSLENSRVPKSKRQAARKVLALQTVPTPPPPPPIVPLQSALATGLVGKYTHSEHELGAGLWLRADGTFRYGLTVGSLDETAAGRWTAKGNRVQLVSEPRPVAPAITAGAAKLQPGAPFSISLRTSADKPVQGVDFTVEFDTGDPVESYTGSDSAVMAVGEKRQPRFVTFTWPSYGLRPARFTVDIKKANVLAFVFTPNDFGVVDLTGLVVEADKGEIALHRDGGVMHFSRGK